MNETVKGTIDRAIVAIVTWVLTWASMKGYIGEGEVANLAPALALVLGTTIAYFVNTPKATINAAAKIDKPVPEITKEIKEARKEDQEL